MKVDLEQLENNEAVLLMYLSGELGDQDRFEVEQMLSSDAGFRAELQALRESIVFADQKLQEFDALDRPAVPESIVRRQVMRLINEWALDRQQPLVIPSIDLPRRNIPWRRIGYAVAACLILGFCFWAGKSTHRPVVAVGPQDSAPQENRGYADSNENYLPPVEINSDQHQATELTSDQKLALLATSLNESSGEDSSTVQLLAVAAAPVSDDMDSVSGNPDHSGQQQNVGEP